MANPDHAGPFLKPYRGDKALMQWSRKEARRKARAHAARAHAQTLSALRREAYARDGGRCRIYGSAVKLTTEDPHELAHSHHVVFRSAGGPDALWNLLTVCAQAHRDIHEHRLRVEGDANKAITIQRVDLETGRVVQEWTSEPRRPA